MAAWPNTLPNTPLIKGYKRIPRDGMRRFNPDLGEAKRNLRYTGVVEDVTENYVLTYDQFNILEQFWKNDLKRGSITMTKVEPQTNVTREYVFLSYDFSVVGIFVEVTLTLEMLP